MSLYKSITTLGLSAALLTSGAYAMTRSADPSPALLEDLAHMEKLWQGEYNNYADVLAAEANQADEPPSQTHYIYKLVESPNFERPVLYVEQAYGAGDDIDMVYRQRVYITTADAYRNELVTVIYSFNDEDDALMARGAWRDPNKLQGITEDDLTALPKGCEIFWNRVGEDVVGYQNYGVCRMTLPGTDLQIFLEDDLVLSSNGFTTFTRGWSVEGKEMIFGETAPHPRPKARRFLCTLPGQTSPVSLHDQGGETLMQQGGEEWTVHLFAPLPYGDALQLRLSDADNRRIVYNATLNATEVTFTPALGPTTCKLA